VISDGCMSFVGDIRNDPSSGYELVTWWICIAVGADLPCASVELVLLVWNVGY